MDTTVDNGTDNMSVPGSPSYTDPCSLVQSESGSQSVHTVRSQGTISPKRGQQTPMSTSPASVSTSQASVHPDVLGTLEPMPQYSTPHLPGPPPPSHLQQQRSPPQQQQQQQRAPGDSGFLMGMRQLERQALDHHHTPVQVMQQQQPQQHRLLQSDYPPTRDRSNPVSDDEQTQQSSSVTTGAEYTANISRNNAAAGGYTRSDAGATSTFGRLIQSANKTISSRNINTGTGQPARKVSQDEEAVLEGALIYGYLQKLGRNGKWQTRWFETDGECLTYYKSSKRVKLLATLDLAKVGSIVINHEDEKGCCFTINISERPYHLRADSKAACKDWVITLNRVKEARMEVGHVKLSMPDCTNNPPDLLDRDYTPRVVVVANRQRTHVVEDDELHSWEVLGGADENNPFVAVIAASKANNPNYNVVIPPTVSRLARWQKPRNSINLIAVKVLAWARSLRKYGCSDPEGHVVLDQRLHPPGHNDPKHVNSTAAAGRGLPYSTSITPPIPSNTGAPSSVAADSSSTSWIQNKNSGERSLPPSVVTTADFLNSESQKHAGSPTADNDDEDDETRELS